MPIRFRTVVGEQVRYRDLQTVGTVLDPYRGQGACRPKRHMFRREGGSAAATARGRHLDAPSDHSPPGAATPLGRHRDTIDGRADIQSDDLAVRRIAVGHRRSRHCESSPRYDRRHGCPPCPMVPQQLWPRLCRGNEAQGPTGNDDAKTCRGDFAEERSESARACSGAPAGFACWDLPSVRIRT